MFEKMKKTRLSQSNAHQWFSIRSNTIFSHIHRQSKRTAQAVCIHIA